MQIGDMRKEYLWSGLSEADVDADPIRQFRTWFEQALAAQLPEPNAMTLATAPPDGRPAARVVLLKAFDEAGFTFFTNYDGRKGRELTANPQAALLFFWPELQRQVRIEGTVERVSESESDAYFVSRPLGSRLGAWASRQSEVIPSRDVLEDRVREAGATLPGRPGAAAAVLGRLSRPACGNRVLAGTARPPARPPALSVHPARRLAHRTAVAMTLAPGNAERMKRISFCACVVAGAMPNLKGEER